MVVYFASNLSNKAHKMILMKRLGLPANQVHPLDFARDRVQKTTKPPKQSSEGRHLAPSFGETKIEYFPKGWLWSCYECSLFLKIRALIATKISIACQFIYCQVE